MRSKNAAFTFSITLAQLAGCYLIFGARAEEYEAVFQNFFAGVYTLPPAEMVFIDIYGGIIPVLCKLAHAAYPYPVNEYLLYAIIAASCFIINYCVYGFLEHACAPKASFLVTFVTFSFLLFPQFLVLLQCTRASILVITAAFFAAAWFFTQGRQNSWRLLVIILLLAAGTVLRIFTAGITTGLILILVFLIWRFDFLRSKYGWLFMFFFLIQSGLIAGLMYYRSHSDHPGERYVMTYEYAVTNRNDLFPLSPGSSRQDTMRYELMQNWLVTDTAALSESFLRKHIRHVTITDILSDRDYLAERLAVSVAELGRFSKQYFYAILILAGIIVMLPMRQKIQGAAWVTVVAVLQLMLTVIGSMYDRGFAPFICLLVFGWWLLWAQQPNFYSRNAQYLFLLLALFASFFSIGHLGEIRRENLRWHEAARQFYQTALSLDSLHPVMMQSADMVMFSKKAFEKFPPRTGGNIIMLNAGYLSFFEFIKEPYREQYSLDITNGRSVADFIRSQNKKGVVLLTTNERCRLFKDYLKVFYGLDIDTEDLNVPPIESPQHTLHFFRIKVAGET